MSTWWRRKAHYTDLTRYSLTKNDLNHAFWVGRLQTIGFLMHGFYMNQRNVVLYLLLELWQTPCMYIYIHINYAKSHCQEMVPTEDVWFK